ncbi:MAG: hypothetical protein LQ346_007722 [Caloplaca aetnensis]|nr:MAG: hypothetical protein LQ346_007722 [Caloplaca aetnensis]
MQSTLVSLASPEPASTSPLAPSSARSNPTQQARRLQLRNAGFRGQTVAVRRISPILASSGLPSEPFCRIVSNENTPHNLERRQLFGENLPPNHVNILQELHNSARRKRHSSRQSIGAIFHDDTATAGPDENSASSCYSVTSNRNTPLASRNFSTPMMKPREVSFNGRTPPPMTSPVAKQSRGRNGTRMHQRSTSAEAAKYIDHLESQLLAVNTKLDSLMSPTSHKTRAAKLRTLNSEARSLRQQVLEWEQKFEERIKDERDQLAEVEMSLTDRLQALEDEVEAKDNRVKDLEWEIGNLKTRIKHAEGLELVNTDLERRIDLLTNLLVRSPTKLDLCSAATSPSKEEPHSRIPRPRSMMPRIPPSPGTLRLSLNTSSDMQYRRPRRSTASTSTASPSPESATAVHKEQMQTTEGMKESKTSFQSGSGDSSIFRSPPSSSSRPTSLYSSSSFGACSWGLPLPPEPAAAGKVNPKQRRMRRFPSGAASLKPLILPTAAGTPSLPASAPVHDTFRDPPHRTGSDISLDPTVAFLSRLDFSSPISTPTQPSRRKSVSPAHSEALYALEGHSGSFADKDDGQSMLSPRSFSDEPLETVEEESADIKSSKRERPRSLGEELEEAGMHLRNSFDDGLIPHAGESGDQGIAIDSVPSRDASEAHTPSQQHSRRKPIASKATPNLRVAPVQYAASSSRSSASTAITTPPQADSLLSRVKCVVSRTRQGPSALAQQLIYNAWATGWARLGGLGWWLLGLVYGSRWRKKKRVADAEPIVEEVPTSDMQVPPGASGQKSRECPDLRRDWRIICDDSKRLTTSDGSPIQVLAKDHSHRRQEAHLIPCPDCKEPSSRRSLRLWFRFSLAIVLAVGIAIKDGPGALLEGCPEHHVEPNGAWQSSPSMAKRSADDRTFPNGSGPLKSVHGTK